MTAITEIKTLPFQVNQKIVDILLVATEQKKRHQAEQKATHTKLWDAVHNEYPELEKEANYTLKTEYLEQGVVMLETHECNHNIPDFLQRLIKDIN